MSATRLALAALILSFAMDINSATWADRVAGRGQGYRVERFVAGFISTGMMMLGLWVVTSRPKDAP